jgi:hypothetical protein
LELFSLHERRFSSCHSIALGFGLVAMHSKIICLLGFACLLLTLAPNTSHAQLPGNYRGPQDAYGLKLTIPFPANYPPIQTGMPSDVREGYVYFDSIVRSIDIPRGQLDALKAHFGYSDTLKKLLKYIYEMSDFDVQAYFQFLQDEPRTSAYAMTSHNIVLQELLRKAAQVFPDSGVSASLCYVGAIVQVAVTDTSTIINSSMRSANLVGQVTCTIEDIVKGQNLPACPSPASAGKRGMKTTSIGDCLKFEYQLYWQSQIHSPSFMYNPNTYYSTSGSPWVQKGQEYIVCLDLRALGRDSTQLYTTLMPGFGASTMIGIYPIVNGVVQDPQNDFRIGTNLSVADFKTRLRQKIHSLVTP